MLALQIRKPKPRDAKSLALSDRAKIQTAGPKSTALSSMLPALEPLKGRLNMSVENTPMTLPWKVLCAVFIKIFRSSQTSHTHFVILYPVPMPASLTKLFKITHELPLEENIFSILLYCWTQMSLFSTLIYIMGIASVQLPPVGGLQN